MKTVHLVRNVPEHNGGPLECDASEDAVSNYKKRGWREAEQDKRQNADAEVSVTENAEKADSKPVSSKQHKQDKNQKQEPAKEEISDKNLF